MSNIRTAIVCMAANENLYIRDFVKWHVIIGFSKIFIIDNSPVNGEHMELILADYIKAGRVQIIRMCKNTPKNLQYLQMIVYTEMFNIFRSQFDWMFFIDVDEFVMLTGKAGTFNINEFLDNERFVDAEQIRFNWQCYGDNGKLYYDNEPVWKRFPNPMSDINKHDWAGPYPVNMTLKTAVRCTTEYANFIATGSPHYPMTPSKENAIVVSPSGKKRPVRRAVNFIDYELAFLAHYRTLTVTEYLYRRFNPYSLGNPTGAIHSEETLLKQFCVENEMTPAKQKIWDEYFDMIEREHPGLFKTENIQVMTRPSNDELLATLNDVRDVIIGKKIWNH